METFYDVMRHKGISRRGLLKYSSLTATARKTVGAPRQRQRRRIGDAGKDFIGCGDAAPDARRGGGGLAIPPGPAVQLVRHGAPHTARRAVAGAMVDAGSDRPADAAWLRRQPLAALPASADAPSRDLLQDLQRALLPWLESEVLGGPAAGWLAAFSGGDHSASGALQQWSARRHLPAQRWLHGAGAAGRALALPCRALPAAALEADALRALAATLDAVSGFALQPTWQGEPAETGCWTRVGDAAAVPRPHNAWMRWLYRIAELIALAQADAAPRLRSGMLALGGGQGMAWSEMSRGLLMYAVRLVRRSSAWVVDSCRVIAPTEWNLHPEGSLAVVLRTPGLAMDSVRAAVAAMDPCVEVTLSDIHAGAAHA
jgi:hypothetical protein